VIFTKAINVKKVSRPLRDKSKGKKEFKEAKHSLKK